MITSESQLAYWKQTSNETPNTTSSKNISSSKAKQKKHSEEYTFTLAQKKLIICNDKKSYIEMKGEETPTDSIQPEANTTCRTWTHSCLIQGHAHIHTHGYHL